MKQRKTDRFGLMRANCMECHNKPNLWSTWWLADITVVAHTLSLTDTLVGTTTNNIFIMSE